MTITKSKEELASSSTPSVNVRPKRRKKVLIAGFIRKYGTPLAVLIGALIIGGSIYISFGIPNQKALQKLSTSPAAVAQKPGTEPTALDAVKVNVSVDDDAMLGQENAPVTIIEFSDFQCPFCRKFWSETLPFLKTNYIESGKVKFVYRDFPLDIHPGAKPAAEGAECAREQGKFWEMHDKIFIEQAEKGQGAIQFGAVEIKQWAREIGLNSRTFNLCLDSGKYESEVKKDLNDALEAGVDATPTFFVNGQSIRGALPYNIFVQAIEENLTPEGK